MTLVLVQVRTGDGVNEELSPNEPNSPFPRKGSGLLNPHRCAGLRHYLCIRSKLEDLQVLIKLGLKDAEVVSTEWMPCAR